MSNKIIPVIDPNFNKYDKIIELIENISFSNYKRLYDKNEFQNLVLNNSYLILKIISKFYNYPNEKSYYIIKKNKVSFILEEIINNFIIKEKSYILSDAFENMSKVKKTIMNRINFEKIKRKNRQIPHNFLEFRGGNNNINDPIYINTLYDEPIFIFNKLPIDIYDKNIFFGIFFEIYRNLIKKFKLCQY